ncbi:MAG: glutamine synthetase family protein [Candidatus Thorarchaeota archaeon]
MSDSISYVVLQFSDLEGQLKAMVVPCRPAHNLEDLESDPVVQEGSSVDGSSVAGLASVEASDLRLKPEPSTLVELPYTARRLAAVMCCVQRKEDIDLGKFHDLDSRAVLQRVYDRYLPDGMHLRVKTEPEFFFLTADGELLDEGQYADTYPACPAQDTLLEIATAAQEMGIGVRVAHHEVGTAQHEIELEFSDARKMADSILRFKNLARALALEDGIDVTFMPKLFPDVAGSGLHCHLQLWKEDENLFGGDTQGELSDTAKSFLAGLMEHAPAITAIANSTINSYKRLVPHHEAPVYISWGYRNRTALIRVPLFTTPEKAAIEFRSPDMMTNPYLLFAAIIVAGMDGVENGAEPPEPLTQDIFKLSDKEREALNIPMLPSNLYEALRHLREDRLIREALGDGLIDAYIRLKTSEWEEYVNRAVTDWEWERYGEA